MIKGIFLHNFSLYSRKLIGLQEKDIQVTARLRMQFPINLKRPLFTQCSPHAEKKTSRCSGDKRDTPSSNPLNQSDNSMTLKDYGIKIQNFSGRCIQTKTKTPHRLCACEVSLRKLGDSNPRYGNPYGSLANCWFQPLTQSSNNRL